MPGPVVWPVVAYKLPSTGPPAYKTHLQHTVNKQGKWAAKCDFQQWSILTCVDSDQPVQPPVNLRNSKWCSVSSLTVIEYSSDLQWLWSNCAYVQAGLSLCLLHIPHCWKPHALAQMVILEKRVNHKIESCFSNLLFQVMAKKWKLKPVKYVF